MPRKSKFKAHRKAVPRLPKPPELDQSKLHSDVIVPYHPDDQIPMPPGDLPGEREARLVAEGKLDPTTMQRTDMAQSLDEPKPQPPSPPTDTLYGGKPTNLDEEEDIADLKARGFEQSWVPPALLYKGRLIANMPRGLHRQLKSYEMTELARVVAERGDGSILQIEDVERLLGWKVQKQ